MKRSTHIDHDVVYAEVGASAAPDLMRFPPEGTTPYTEELQLGSGTERFLSASSLLMTWGGQQGAGFEIRDVEPGDGGHYDGIVLDEHGTPQPAAAREDSFGPNGEPYLTAGTTLTVASRDGKEPSRTKRVVFVIEEPQRVGFAWGTADELGPVGEELFIVEHRDDDTVWARVQGFVRMPNTGLLGIRARASVKRALAESVEQLEALFPGRTHIEMRSDTDTRADEMNHRGRRST